MKPFISLCMIVRNEEKVIGRCLSSISHLVDEIIIVDTGSTDRTKEIISEFPVKLFDFEWINDFSAARNYASSKANGEWIVVLDADEYVDEENFKNFIQELNEENGEYDAYSAKILNFTGNYGENLVQNYHDRIYRNNGKISYTRKIHEQFIKNNNEPVNIKISSLLIFHSGYLTQTVIEKDKKERNKELLDQELSNSANNAFDYFNLGNEYSSIGEYSKALDSYLLAYNNKTDFRLSWVSTTLIQIVICLMNLKRYKDALNVINDAQHIYPNSPEFPYLKGEIFFLRGQLDDAKKMFLQVVNNTDHYHHILFRNDLKEQRPHIRLGEIFLNEEDYNGAIYHYTSVLNINNNHKGSINKVIYILNKFHSPEEISEFLFSKGMINSVNIKDYVRACFNNGNPNLALKLLENMNEENTLLLSKVALLKKLVINNEGNINDIVGVFEDSVIQPLMDSNWINIVDLLLLRNGLVYDEAHKINILSSYEENKDFKLLLGLMNGKTLTEEIDENLVLYTFQMLINYNKFSICGEMLKYIENLNGKILVNIASILFVNGFKAEALQLYDKCDWNDFEEQDFINIINSLLETDNSEGAVDIAKYAIMIYENDFRFYKYVLKQTKDANLYNSTLNNAKELFNDSLYLENLKR